LPKRTPSQRTRRTGEAFVAQVVSEMGFIWNPEHEDNAVDGTIQIVAHDGKVTALRILAQVKSTTMGLGWDGDRFSRSFIKDHIDFWLEGPLPVIVVIVDLRTKAAWWKDVRVCFVDRGNYRRRSVIFEHEADRFSTDTASRLADSRQGCSARRSHGDPRLPALRRSAP
jgi:Domain of unknown function (DUF4365)